MKSWWLGFNNDVRQNKVRGDGSPSQAMFHGDVREFLENPAVTTLMWRRHPGNYRSSYDEMNLNDPVLLWMGDGSLHLPWGVMGFAHVLCKDAEHVTLQQDWIPPHPWCPTASHDVEFLFDLLGPNFEPLAKVFANAGLMQGRSIVSAYQIEHGNQIEVIRRRMTRIGSQGLQRAA